MSSTTRDFRARERGGLRSVEARDYESTPSLLRRFVDDVGMLFAQELALLKAEMTRSIGDLKAAAVSIAVGGAVAFVFDHHGLQHERRAVPQGTAHRDGGFTR